MHIRTRLSTWASTFPRMLWVLACASFLNATGLAFIWPLTTVYIHDYLGHPMTVAGVVLLLHSAGAILGQLAGGWLFDRIGARQVMTAGILTSSVLTGLLGLYEWWPLYITVMIAFGFTGSLPFPPIYALVARSWPGQGRRAFNFSYVANNVGVAVGTALGGLLADRSFAMAFYGAAVLFLLFGLFTVMFIRENEDDEPSVIGESTLVGANQEGVTPWVPISALFVAYLVLWLIYVQWQATVSVHMRAQGHELASYSILWTFNGLLIFAGQPLLSWVVRRVRQAQAQMALGIVLYAIAFGVLLVSNSYSIFVTSMVLLTFGEMLLWPSMPAAVARLSPPAKRGSLQGFILSGAAVGRMLGPLLGGLLYDTVGFAVLLMVMVSGLLLPLMGIALFARTQPAVTGSEGD